MTNAIFTAAESSAYDDLIEAHYHFPRTYLRQVEQSVGDWVTVRNGIALTGTAHWLFDRGLMSITDDYSILLSPQGVPDDLDKLIRSERTLLLPANPDLRPHRTYLAWHREHRFKR